jgi:hypothetical protein
VTVVDVADTGPRSVTLHFDSFGDPHIIYRKAEGLWHAYFDGLAWQKEPVDPTPGAGTSSSMAIGPGDVLHVAYHVNKPLNRPLRYARGVAGAWTIETVEGDENEGRFLDMTSNAGGHASVVLYDETRGDVQMAYRNGPNDWTFDAVLESGDVGRFVRQRRAPLPVQSADLLYYDATNGLIREIFGTFDNWNFTASPIASGFAVAGLSFADSAGWRRVAYYDSLAGDLWYGRFGPGSVSKVLVDAAGDVGRSCSLGMDANQMAHIVYINSSTGRLMQARQTVPGWLTGAITGSGDVGRSCALVTRGNLSEVAYYEQTHGDLWRARSGDGATWDVELVDSTGDVGRGCAIALNGPGEPRITYYDATNGDLRFAAPLATGGWDITVVDAYEDVGLSSSLWVDPETNLAQIAYYNATQGRALFASQYYSFTDDVPASDHRVSMPALSITPNPARTGVLLRLSVNVPDRVVGDIRIYDVLGRRIGTIADRIVGGEAPALDWRVPRGCAGLLFVEARLGNGKTLSSKVAVIQ